MNANEKFCDAITYIVCFRDITKRITKVFELYFIFNKAIHNYFVS